MRQLSGMDSEFLAMESGSVVGHFGTVTLLARPADERVLDARVVRAHVASRLHLVPVLRQRLVPVMWGVDQPYWVDDRAFDLSRHVLEVQLPEGSGVDRLAEAVADLHRHRLDRNRPLWELYFLTGLSEGRSAFYLKIHHAVMDGAGWSALMGALLDPEPGPPDVAPPRSWQPEPVPTHLELLGMSGWSMARMSLRSMKLGMEFMARAPVLAARQVVPPPQSEVIPLTAPPTPFNHQITGARSCALVDLPMDSVQTVRRSVGATVNDVVMTLCAGALRRWLQDHEALPARPLVAVVPVSVRGRDDQEPLGNRLGLVRGLLPTHLEDPLARLAAMREEMNRARERRAALPPQLLVDAADYAPPMVAEAGWWLTSRVMRRVNAWNVMISNVRGPSAPRFFAGAQVIANYPVSVIVHGQGLNLSVFSVAGRLCFGLVADPMLVPDLPRLGEYLAEDLESLCSASTSGH